MGITSRHNETLKGIRRLRRRQGDHALLEGPHLLREALARGLELDSVLLSATFVETPAGGELAARLARSPLIVAPDLLATLTDADAPRGALAVARLPRPGVEALDLVADATVLYLDGIQDPGNLGALARVAEAFGVAALALAPGSCHPNHPRALRASAGSLLRLPVALRAAPEDLDARWPQAPRWIGLEAHGGAALPGTPPAGALVLALGAEGGGLSPVTAARLDARWTVPVAAPVESLNVAVAAGIALFALARGQDRRN